MEERHWRACFDAGGRTCSHGMDGLGCLFSFTASGGLAAVLVCVLCVFVEPAGQQGTDGQRGVLEVDMAEPPSFSKQVKRPKRQPTWQACADFTDGQASATKCALRALCLFAWLAPFFLSARGPCCYWPLRAVVVGACVWARARHVESGRSPLAGAV